MRVLAPLLLALAAPSRAANPKNSGCVVQATWPDGRVEDRECIVEGEGRSGRRSSGREAIGASFGWLKDTRWNWNRWRDVIFRADGSFLAPAEGCEAEGNPACRWYTSEDDVIVKFGGAGQHKLSVDSDRRTMSGFRESDGDAVTAERVK
mmetsp:Transcript_27639/g.82618  ORF Transcript_27639/g.82618 Transcript_27639/m.82618 type:complete len:150 (-) Transcript_27639:281-730(-)|eukprot:CAMPEP_0202738830 /NCGR_PEP_ID=MMETSP1388-20130828/2441_1 /ASSEMBLY_ACC=CAM_ASM_000864 /TAXON_ID=37098 /ORGANISM="Isochrysis sp, Strain CCMP1244" /LENGTH=149 /DNA_ID=CAMNT_0049405469 /DNA_START=61 /DNA_END=510 /DNA_ORIENTATION=-